MFVRLDLVTLLLALLLAPLTVLTACFAAEVCVGIRKLGSRPLPPLGAVKAAIVIPAHDEAEILVDALSKLKAAAGENMRLLLVADNCTDATAEIGRSLGIEVIERFNPNQRGKGFALDFAKRHLEGDPPQVVIIIDADCSTDARSLRRLVDSCHFSQRPCQGAYLQAPADRGPASVQISTFAFFIKNLIRQRGLQRLADRVLLVGSGMAFPWPVFAKADLATSSIVEDLKLGLELAEAGHAPMLIEQALIWGSAETAQNTLSQRRRWEGGFLRIAFGIAPGLLAEAIGRLDRRAIWASLSLMIPPIALLFVVDVAALGLAGLATWLVGARTWPLILLASVIALAGFAVVLAWLRGGRRFVPFSSLIRAPLYVLWKIPLYLRLASRGAPKEWLRTQRGEH